MSFGIVVLEACNTTNAANLVFVPVKLPTLAAIAGATQAPQFYGCDDVPGTQDFTLTPADRATVNAVMAQMSTHIEQQASARGWTFFRLADLYERSGVRQPYSAQQQFLTAQPYGPYISLDGLHPSAAGQTILAESAAQALNLKYGDGDPDAPRDPDRLEPTRCPTGG